MITHDFSDWSDSLREFAIEQFVWLSFLEYCSETKQIIENPNADHIRITEFEKDHYTYWNWWLRFGVGFESLIKSVFLKHQISLLKKRNLTDKAIGGLNQLQTQEASNVYTTVKTTKISSISNQWLSNEFVRLSIQHPLEINTGTLRNCKEKLPALKNSSVITPTEEIFLSDAITLLSDIRRNVDAHIFLKMQVGGSINGDLTSVYIPAINILLDK
jgi:hypothetical protein